MTEIRSVVHSSSRNFHVLFYDIKYIRNACDFLKLLLVLKKVVANKWPNETTEIVRNIKIHHAEQVNSSTQ